MGKGREGKDSTRERAENGERRRGRAKGNVERGGMNREGGGKGWDGREERKGREIAPYLVLKVGAYAMPHGTTERRHHITELQQRSTARIY